MRLARADNFCAPRAYVGHGSLARRTTPDVDARLKAFTADPAPIVRGEAERYLRERAGGKKK